MKFLFLLISFFLSADFSNAAQVIKADHVRVQLLSSQDSWQGVLQLAVHYELDPHWHIYWKNPGDSGAAPKFKVNGGRIDKIRWPYPSRIPVGPLTNFGYEGETAILLDIVPEEGVQFLRLNLEWLVCKVECLPGHGEFKIDLTNLGATEDQKKLYNKFLDLIPESTSQWRLRTTNVTESALEIEMTSATGISSFNNLYVYPEDKELFLTKAPEIRIEGEQVRIQLPLSSNAQLLKDSTKITFVLKGVEEFVEAFEASVPLKAEEPSVLLGILFAFLGGIILNLMPCVFPVLSLKVFSFMKEANNKRIRTSGWAYTAGVLATFLAVGGLLTILRFSGEAVGWGYQLQKPWFTFGLAILFFCLALNFWGLFEIGNSIANWGGRFSGLKFLSGSFGSGVLAVIVATPCTAPFMGTALGLTLLLPWFFSLLIFLSLGAGMATPMLVLSHIPNLRSRLPRSGKWMEWVKKALAIPLMLTSLWLLSIHGADWVLNKDNWEKFDEKVLLEKHRTQPVFVDFTAAWCITCQINKKAVLETSEIQKVFKENNVFLMRADWTDEDAAITKALAGFGRNSVPLYVFYEVGKEPKILPQLLTRDMIIELFEEEGD